MHDAEHPWHVIGQTTSTFGVRRDALVRDARLLRWGSTVGAPFDASTWAALQHVRPFAWRHLLSDLDGYASVRGLGKVVAKPAARLVLNLVSVWGRHPTRQLVAPTRDLAVHAESGRVPEDVGWDELGRAASVGPTSDD